MSEKKAEPYLAPILIVAYARDQNLDRIISLVANRNRKLYVFVDGPANSEILSNVLNVRRVVRDNAESIKEAMISESNFGVGRAIPAALDWIFEHENEIVILEDDCIPSGESLRYFDEMLQYVKGDTALISGSSPYFWSEITKNNKITSSQYPLIWGWATTKESWISISEYINSKARIRDCVFSLLRAPRKLLPFCYFLSAYINIKKGRLQAWDSLIALNFLIKNKTALIPPYSLVVNIGNDSSASHDMSNSRFVFKEANIEIPELESLLVSSAKNERWKMDREIANEIYNIKLRNILSPIKAFIKK